MQKKKLVVVTGGAGYLGSVMVPLLLQEGYRVRVVDRFFFGQEPLAYIAGDIERVEADTRWCPEEVFEGAFAVVDLAALSNDPAGELDPERTLDINYRARVRTAALAKRLGAERYVLASTCSVYGFQNNIVDETVTPSPITTYAQSSLKAEGEVLLQSDEKFAVTILRQGTLYGPSPRMRFDVVVNVMTLSLHRGGSIEVRGGEQWRPLLHVADSAAAFVRVLGTPAPLISGEIFNLGATEHNFKVIDIAKQVRAGTNIDGRIVHDKTALDTRSYRVSFEKIRRALGFAPKYNPQGGAQQVSEALQRKSIADDIKTRTIDWYKQLSEERPRILDEVHHHARWH